MISLDQRGIMVRNTERFVLEQMEIHFTTLPTITSSAGGPCFWLLASAMRRVPIIELEVNFSEHYFESSALPTITSSSNVLLKQRIL